MATTTPPSVPLPSTTPNALKRVLTLLALAAAALPTSGLLANAPAWVTQLDGALLAALTFAGYTAHTSALKAQARALLPRAIVVSDSVTRTPERGVALPSTMLIMFALVAPAAAVMLSCGATGTEIKQAAGSAGSAFVACEDTNLEASVGVGSAADASFLSVLLADLVSTNYLGLIGSAIAEYGGATVSCVLVAIEDFANTLKSLKAQGTALLIGAPDPDLLLARVAQIRLTYAVQLKTPATATAKSRKIAR